MFSTRSPVDHGHRDHGHRTTSWVWHFAGCKRWEKTTKCLWQEPKDNRTAHLTAHSDKSVAYITNNKRLYSMFCTVEANYWQTRSFAWLFATAELLVINKMSARWLLSDRRLWWLCRISRQTSMQSTSMEHLKGKMQDRTLTVSS